MQGERENRESRRTESGRVGEQSAGDQRVQENTVGDQRVRENRVRESRECGRTESAGDQRVRENTCSGGVRENRECGRSESAGDQRVREIRECGRTECGRAKSAGEQSGGEQRVREAYKLIVVHRKKNSPPFPLSAATWSEPCITSQLDPEGN